MAKPPKWRVILDFEPGEKDFRSATLDYAVDNGPPRRVTIATHGQKGRQLEDFDPGVTSNSKYFAMLVAIALAPKARRGPLLESELGLVRNLGDKTEKTLGEYTGRLTRCGLVSREPSAAGDASYALTLGPGTDVQVLLAGEDPSPAEIRSAWEYVYLDAVSSADGDATARTNDGPTVAPNEVEPIPFGVEAEADGGDGEARTSDEVQVDARHPSSEGEPRLSNAADVPEPAAGIAAGEVAAGNATAATPSSGWLRALKGVLDYKLSTLAVLAIVIVASGLRAAVEIFLAGSQPTVASATPTWATQELRIQGRRDLLAEHDHTIHYDEIRIHRRDMCAGRALPVARSLPLGTLQFAGALFPSDLDRVESGGGSTVGVLVTTQAITPADDLVVVRVLRPHDGVHRVPSFALLAGQIQADDGTIGLFVDTTCGPSPDSLDAFMPVIATPDDNTVELVESTFVWLPDSAMSVDREQPGFVVAVRCQNIREIRNSAIGSEPRSIFFVPLHERIYNGDSDTALRLVTSATSAEETAACRRMHYSRLEASYYDRIMDGLLDRARWLL